MINKNQIYSNLDPNCVRNIQSKRKTCRSMLLTSAFFVLLKAKSYQCSGLLTCTTAIKLRRSLFVAWARYYYVQSQSWLMLSILKTTLMHISKTIAPYTSTTPDNNNAQFTRGTLRKNNISILTSWLCALHIVGFFSFLHFIDLLIACIIYAYARSASVVRHTYRVLHMLNSSFFSFSLLLCLHLVRSSSPAAGTAAHTWHLTAY